MTNTNKYLLSELAALIRLREGSNGIAKALWYLFRGNTHSTHDWSRAVHIPVPVLAALRRELEKLNILSDDKRIVLTDEGKTILQTLFKSKEIPKSDCVVCDGLGYVLPTEAQSLIHKMREISENRPSVDVTLDQSHATPENSIRKAMLLLEKGLLDQSILFLGDDDLISIACMLVRYRYFDEVDSLGPMLVLDIDERYLNYIDDQSNGLIETFEYDVRKELPKVYQNQFHTALTDPAYTVNGITAFAYRCHEATDESGTMYLSMPHIDPQASGEIQTNLLQMGWTLRGQYNQFNEYTGASIHAHVSSLYIWEKWKANQTFSGIHTDMFYTAERKVKE